MAILATAVTSAASAQSRDDRRRSDRTVKVVCESHDGRRHRCAADTQGQITLSRQLTRRSKCVQGRTWGYDRNAIWVDGGCRAEFLIADNGTRTLVCESNGSRRSYCRGDAPFGVRLTRQLGHAECVLNRTWGSDRNGVWVSNGCRAEFAFKTRQ